jgi:TetR/AcrR family transcriptional regulator, transcriptional repressor for nem operon
MRYGAGHKEQTRERILRAAARLFRRDGYHSAGVDKVMEAAGLTAGGFYAHFPSKEALLAETLAPASEQASDSNIQGLEGRQGRAWVEGFLANYLSPAHLASNYAGCPLPALVSEIARTGPPVKSSFETVVRRFADLLQRQSEDSLSEDRALALVALCVGGISVARSIQDQALAERVLKACRELAEEAMENPKT